MTSGKPDDKDSDNNNGNDNDNDKFVGPSRRWGH